MAFDIEGGVVEGEGHHFGSRDHFFMTHLCLEHTEESETECPGGMDNGASYKAVDEQVHIQEANKRVDPRAAPNAWLLVSINWNI